MQTFKEISYQNYIELRFNPKNLDKTSQEQAYIKYKRNAQLLAEIFSFEDKPRQSHEVTPVINEEHLKELEREIEQEKKEGERRCKQIQESSKNYANFLRKIKEVKTHEDKLNIIEQLKQTDMYDAYHPYFAESSPFFMLQTDEQVLQVRGQLELPNEEEFSIMEIKQK